jgi:alkanesulfonate monooxygenase SsuD/methylene tetrahydromethanopterin reductase-like flavin-dependent oxidoreductase (luciferase family)
MLAVIGGDPVRFLPFVTLYHQALAQHHKPVLPIGMHSPGYVAETDEQARDDVWPHYAALHERIGAERGWPPMERDQFEHSAGPQGALFVGSAETVAAKIVRAAQALGLARFDMKYSMGTLPHHKLMASIRRYATDVVPLVQAQLAPTALP